MHPSAISGDGSSVAGYVAADPFYCAFVWRGAKVELLPGLGESSLVRALSGDGRRARPGFVWSERRGSVPLDRVLEQLGVDGSV